MYVQGMYVLKSWLFRRALGWLKDNQLKTHAASTISCSNNTPEPHNLIHENKISRKRGMMMSSDLNIQTPAKRRVATEKKMDNSEKKKGLR